ncbi:hypothetical protein BDK51DRAFT_46554 [Blyttiomyces helicus]|uniref:Uncharacterized protein n=1 Tax=Blyttiomyces helicus TaxID=388810 RepID=A0A4P9WGI0_9FUNG|nr:hypothetical protein BDK51DRAFT_46554 [Blyttiomyces helicus]|eukprot:RKO90468.1 hypothetical protein BDK51DRAFT_46554 [Blyttiomyces helicus]
MGTLSPADIRAQGANAVAMGGEPMQVDEGGLAAELPTPDASEAGLEEVEEGDYEEMQDILDGSPAPAGSRYAKRQTRTSEEDSSPARSPREHGPRTGSGHTSKRRRESSPPRHPTPPPTSAHPQSGTSSRHRRRHLHRRHRHPPRPDFPNPFAPPPALRLGALPRIPKRGGRPSAHHSPPPTTLALAPGAATFPHLLLEVVFTRADVGDRGHCLPHPSGT